MNIADLMFHVHPELNAQQKTELARKLEGQVGIDCAEFSRRSRTHSLLVKYDPDTVNGMDILQLVRSVDPAATMVGL